MNQTDVELKETRYSGLNILSFSMYQIVWSIIFSALNLTYFFFYHTVVGLEPIYIFIAMAIFTAWDSINEPLLAYLVDRNFKWTRKWGRRFPWVVVCIIPWCLSVLVFHLRRFEFGYALQKFLAHPWYFLHCFYSGEFTIKTT